MKYRLPPLNALRMLEAVVRHRSVRHAAEELCVTPQAVSHQLKQLEEALGGLLFERHVRSVEPTVAAEMLAAYVARGLDEIAEGVERVRRERLAPRLYLHVSPYFADVYLLRNLSQFLKSHPGLDFNLSIGTELVDFDSAGVDAAINWGYEGREGYVAVPLIEDLKVVVCSPELARSRPLQGAAGLAAHTLIVPLGKNRLWQDALAHLGAPVSSQQATLPLQTNSAILEASLCGLGVGFVSYLSAVEEIQAGRLVAPLGVDALRDLDIRKTPRYSLLFRASRREHPVLKSFVQWLTTLMRDEAIVGYPLRVLAPDPLGESDTNR